MDIYNLLLDISIWMSNNISQWILQNLEFWCWFPTQTLPPSVSAMRKSTIQFTQPKYFLLFLEHTRLTSTAESLHWFPEYRTPFTQRPAYPVSSFHSCSNITGFPMRSLTIFTKASLLSPTHCTLSLFLASYSTYIWQAIHFTYFFIMYLFLLECKLHESWNSGLYSLFYNPSTHRTVFDMVAT